MFTAVIAMTVVLQHGLSESSIYTAPQLHWTVAMGMDFRGVATTQRGLGFEEDSRSFGHGAPDLIHFVVRHRYAAVRPVDR